MILRNATAALLFAAAVFTSASAQLTVTFPATDGLTVTADWYPVSDNLPVVLLCHQDNSSRGEFSEIALKLNKFGFNCLAIDQRKGAESNGVKNITAAEASKKGKLINYEEAEKDISGAVDYLFEKYKSPCIILGSSYSASLALKLAAAGNKISAVAVFSPGEYFTVPDYVYSNISGLTKPVFATSSRAEADSVTSLLRDVNSRIKVQYVPDTEGEHGAKALWSSTPYHQEYWIALMSFLDKMKSLNR